MLEFEVPNVFAGMRRLSLLALIATIGFAFFMFMPVLKGDTNFNPKILELLAIPIIAGIFFSGLMLIVGNLSYKKYRIYFNEKKITVFRKTFFIDSEKDLVYFSNIEMVCVSSIRFRTKRGYYYIPTLSLFTKTGDEMVLKNYGDCLTPDKIAVANATTQDLAFKMGCDFFAGQYAHKVERFRRMDGKLGFRHVSIKRHGRKHRF